jgi:hypothetical protein
VSHGWWKQEKKSARKLRAMAVADYARARRHIDQARHAELREVIPQTPHVDVPELVGDLPVPRWDRVPPTTPVDRVERDFAVAMLDVAHQAEVLSAPDRKWRKVFARNAGTAADLLVLFLDTEPYLRHRSADPALATPLARLAFVPEILQARSRGRLSKSEFAAFLERTGSGESLDTLRAELGTTEQAGRPRVASQPPVRRVEQVAASGGAIDEGSFDWLGGSSREDRPSELTTVPEPEPPATDLDRARIAKYLQQALAEERLDPGEHAARTLALWSAATTRELARLVVDLPVPADEPLRDRKFDHRADDLIAPADRQAVLDRLNHAMAGHRLTLWEYETRLDVALKARTYEELWPAVAGLR